VAAGSTDSWRLRRRYMFATLVFCKAVIAYILWRDLDSESAQTAVNMAFIIIGTTVSSYVFGAVWQDVSSWNISKKDNTLGGYYPMDGDMRI